MTLKKRIRQLSVPQDYLSLIGSDRRAPGHVPCFSASRAMRLQGSHRIAFSHADLIKTLTESAERTFCSEVGELALGNTRRAHKAISD